MKKFEITYFVFMTCIFATFVFLISRNLNNKAIDLEAKKDISMELYDNDDRILSIANKVAYILNLEDMNVGDIIDTNKFSNEEVVNYLENSLFYQVTDTDYFDLDYVVICNDIHSTDCILINDNYDNSYGISVNSLYKYAYRLFNRELVLERDFSYNGMDFVFPSNIIKKDIRLLFDKYIVNGDNNHYLIEYKGLLDSNEVIYNIILDIIDKEDIREATFDDVVLKYIERIK